MQLVISAGRTLFMLGFTRWSYLATLDVWMQSGFKAQSGREQAVQRIYPQITQRGLGRNQTILKG
jgi:hypothetical protein